MADVRLPALSPLKDAWNVGDFQKEQCRVSAGGDVSLMQQNFNERYSEQNKGCLSEKKSI